MTASEENNIRDLKKMIEKGTLPHMDEAYRSESVIMDEDGYLRSRSGVADSVFDQKRQDLGYRRKNLVLGFGHHEEHTLAQANRIIEMEWEEFKREHNVSFLDSMKIVVDSLT